MEKEILREILLSQEKIKRKNNIIERDLMKNIKKSLKNPFIIIISGIRRCGKSTLLNELKDKNAYYVNFDDERFINFKVEDFQRMYELLVELFGERDLFLFDEIQNINGWERFVRRLHNEGKKIFITGSNATMLSKELGTHLTGRHIRFSLYPFSFREFLRLKNFKIPNPNKITSNEKSLIKRELLEFIKKGGFPEYLKYENPEYLSSIYENIIYRDIVTRYNLRSEKALKETVFYVSSNIGKELSFNTIKNLTGLTSTTTIREYFEYLYDSYLIFLIQKFDYSLKRQTYSQKKSYLIDTGMAQKVGFRLTKDIGRLFENLVFIELKRREKEIYFHNKKNECDFIIKNKNKINKAIQVCYELNEKNKKREINGLLEVLNEFKLKEGLILTYDQEKELKKDNKKIIIKPLWRWLLEDENKL